MLKSRALLRTAVIAATFAVVSVPSVAGAAVKPVVKTQATRPYSGCQVTTNANNIRTGIICWVGVNSWWFAS